MKIAADRAERIFPRGFDLRVHVGDAVCEVYCCSVGSILIIYIYFLKYCSSCTV